MKVTLTELGQCFELNLTAETMEDQLALVRLGLNVTKERPSVTVGAYKSSGICASIRLGARAQTTSFVR